MKREERHIQFDERIDRYLRHQMDDTECADFEQEISENQELRERLVTTSLFALGIADEGMRQEGQSQLDAIKQMTRDEFLDAIQGQKNNKPRKPKWTYLKWASGIAAAVIVAIGIYNLRPVTPTQEPEMAETVNTVPVKPTKPHKPAKPTLASLAKEYNKPIAGEPDEFVAIRQQIQNEDSKDMMAVVYDIDKIEAPTYKEGAMGAENAEVIKEMQQMHNDCTHWYKALAFLKKGDKESAIRELNNVKEHGSNSELVKRATSLLKSLGQ